MPKLIIDGEHRLNGIARVSGSKNAALPILAATLLCDGENIIHNCPQLSDISATRNILKYLGCNIKQQDSSLIINAGNASKYDIPECLMGELRSSIIFLGAILAKFGKARLSFPGGCEIGLRPIDLHLKALRQMGVTIDDSYGYLECTVANKLKGAKIALSFPSVGATENIMLASVFADSETIITNAAREPEIVDLANYLNTCGAKIDGAGEGTITIRPVEHLYACEYSVIPDRIVALTYICAAAITNGNITLNNVIPSHLSNVLDIFEEAGCEINIIHNTIDIKAPNRLKAVRLIRTMPYPGFPTDAQAPVMAALSKACGTSVFVENIFESRYKHVSSLNKMGANISTETRTAIVRGVKELHGTTVEATDLRAAAALAIAGLGAKGTTEVSGLSFLDRGYENLETILSELGASIRRVN